MFNFDDLYKLMLVYMLVVVLTIFALEIILLFVQTIAELYGYV